jgi:DNA repair protein RadA/Sms
MKTRVLFACTECGGTTPRWQGQCPSCNEWNTLTEERAPRPARATAGRAGGAAMPAAAVRLHEVGGASLQRWSTGIPEFDFVLGGGLVPGSVVLVGGEPGIGKSTLLLQAAARLETAGRETLYVSGEESAVQVRLRAERLLENAGEVRVLPETELTRIFERISEISPAVLLVDSVQTVYSAELDGVPGSVGQVRECAARLQRFAKESGTTVMLVGHVTKGGGIAGPKTLEHIVDTVLYFEGETGQDHRVLRATKNRFGGVDEIGVFRMTSTGLAGVPNPSELFLGDRSAERSGCATTATMGGSRPLLAEIQALTASASYGSPQRVAAGFDHKRLSLLLAVLERRGKLPFGQLDVFLNVAGGLRITETAADAAVAAALASAVRDRPLPADTLVLGEIGLGGELRSIGQVERRLGEAARLGFTTALIPTRSLSPAGAPPGVRVIGVPDVTTLLDRILG